MAFEFIKQALEEVKYPRFFHCVPLSDEERRRIEALPNLPHSYVEFLNTFGRTRFFRELYRENHQLFVYPPNCAFQWHRTDYMLEIGASASSMPMMFKLSQLNAGKEPPLYDISSGSPRRRAESFVEWLTKAWERTRKKYTKKDWLRVMAGPEPFTDEEKRIVEIRRGFSWRQLAPQYGKVVVEVTNNSDAFLPFYSIGVRDKYGRMTGGYWLDVSKIAPGESKILERSFERGYEVLTSTTAELFDKGEPRPESRDDYWEFKGMVK